MLDGEQEALNALARDDRRRAAAILMTAFGDDVWRHCRLVLGSDDLADEVHQNVFVQAYRDLETWQGRAGLRTWLYAIARHRCLDALKLRRRFFRRFVLTDRLPERRAVDAGAEERLGGAQSSKVIDAALARLAPEVRVAVVLRFFEDMTFEQMAEVCGAKPAALQMRVTRAMPKLRAWLEEMGVRDAG
jgi:RNA polymerase sigma-70 factor, ECF subfamily